jgi:hypothetical protein
LDNRDIDIYDSLPDLLKMAWEQKKQPGNDVYATQDALREEFREKGEAFRWSMPYRHLFQCSNCGYMGTAVYHELENPKIKNKESPLHLVKLWEEEVHQAREHGGDFSEKCQLFLRHYQTNH